MGKYDAPSGTERIVWGTHEYSTEVVGENRTGLFGMERRTQTRTVESGLREINKYLENGWEVKMLASYGTGDEDWITHGVYTVLRKK